MSAKKMVKTCLGSKIFNFFNNAFKNCCVAMNKLRRQQKGRKNDPKKEERKIFACGFYFFFEIV